MENYLPLIIAILHQYGYLILFVGAFFAGETFIIAAAFLASQGYFNAFLVVLISLLGVVFSDSFWYFLGSRYRQSVSDWRRALIPNRYEQKINNFKSNFDGNYKKFLIVGKFIYGLRIVTLLAAGHQRIEYKKFVYYNFIGNIAWLLVVVSVGMLMGWSWDYLEQYNNYWRFLVLAGLVALLALRFFFSHKIKRVNYEPGS